ncbi:MAG: hypothetical protein AAF417_10095 [Pseudomonadota bacterium]
MGQIKRKTSLTLVLALFGITAAAQADPVENVIGLEVTNPGGFVGALDGLFESGAMSGYSVSLWENAFDGSNPSTHTIVARFDDYDAHDSLTAQRLQHPGWARFGLAVRDMSTIVTSGFLIERLADGRVEDDHRAGAAFIASVSDPAAYAAALSRLIDSTDNPGSVRLMESRFGGQGATHAVVISADSMAALNEYLDELLTSDTYREFASDVAGLRTLRTVNGYRLIKRWSD